MTFVAMHEGCLVIHLSCNRWLIQYGATAVAGNLFSDVGTPRVSFVLPSSALISYFSFFFSLLLLEFCFLSGCNNDVLFNLRVPSLTEPGLLKEYSIYQFIFFVSRLRPMGINMQGYQFHGLQRCHRTCGYEALSHHTLFATEARIEDLVLSRIELSTPH